MINKTKPDKKKMWIYGLIILIVIVISATYSIKKRQFLKQQLPQIAEQKSNELYHVSYDSISVDELQGNVFIKNLKVVGDTLRQQALITSKSAEASKALINIYIPTIQLVGFKTVKALIAKKIICDKIIISNPEGTINLYDIKSNKDLKKQSKEFYKQILGKFELIQTNEVEIINAKITAVNYKTKQKKFETFNTSITLNDVRIDSLANADTSRTFFCKDLSLKTERLVVGEKENSVLVSNASYNTTGDKLFIGGIKYSNATATNKITSELKNLEIKQLQIHGPLEGIFVSANTVYMGSSSFVTKPYNQPKKENNKTKMLLPQWLKRLSVNNFTAANISYQQQSDKPGEKDFIIDHSSVSINKIHLDSTTNFDRSVSEMFGSITISNPGIAFVTKDDFYKFSFTDIVMNTADKSIRLKEISLTPTLDEKAFAKKAVFRKDRYDIKFRNIVCKAVDFDKLIKGEVNIGTVETNNSYFKVYLDLAYPSKTSSKIGDYPNQLLFGFKQPIFIGKVIASNAYIEYKERNAKSDSSGIVKFMNSNLVVTNVTNRPKSKTDISEWDYNTNFLGKVILKSHMNFYLGQQEKGLFDINGSMGRVEDTVFNSLSIPMKLIRFDKGLINNAGFNLSGDNYNMKGKVDVDYEHLKISLLKKKDDKIKKKTITSLVANLLVKNSNAEKTAKQEVPVEYKIVTTSPFFYNVWRAIFTGISKILIIAK